MVRTTFLLLLLALAPLLPAQRYTAVQQNGFVILKDEQAGVEARISPAHGGELCSLKYRFRKQWTELLYKACDYTISEGWRGKAPLLWPATGAAGEYQVAGKTYNMPFHGFVQNMPWAVDLVETPAGEARALLSLKDTAETRKIYPFGWRLTVDYRLREGHLFLVYTVGSHAENRQPMFFSIGNHITFRAPFVQGSSGKDVRMDTPATTLLRKNSKNLPTGETTAPPFRNTTALGDLPVKAAVSLSGYEKAPTLTLTDPAGLMLYMRHTATSTPEQPYVQFNVWGDPADGYISPEPWVGLQGAFASKKGLVHLPPGKSWEWRVELYPSHSALQ